MITILLALVLIAAPFLIQTANASPFNGTCLNNHGGMINDTGGFSCVSLNGTFGVQTAPNQKSYSCIHSGPCFICINHVGNTTAYAIPENLTNSTQKCINAESMFL